MNLVSPMTVEEEFLAAGYTFRDVEYLLPDGRHFVIRRPVGLPANVVYTGRSVTFEELEAIAEACRQS